MAKRYVAAVMVVGIIGLMCGILFAETSDKTAAPVKVNNTICPVSGEPVNSMNPVEVEYKGKIYNFCCPACIAPFKADPEKYIAKMSEQKTK